MLLSEENAPPFGQEVGRYQVIEEIGDGAMGRVWRGFDPVIGRPVAIKTVKSEYLTRETRQEYLHRFQREARTAGLLAHPHIVSVFDVGEAYFVMELLEGVTLADLIKHRDRLQLEEALGVLAPVAEAIDFAHRAGVIHRDIKPSNIMIQPDGRPKLMDFGVARLETTSATAPGHFFGSPSYMAPEQITDGEVNPRTDLFAFAVVAYETLTGKRPFQGETITAVIYKVVNEPAPPPSTWLDGLPPHFDDIFRRALAKRPADRFPCATAMVAAMRGADIESLLAPLVADVPADAPAEEEVASVETHDIPGVRTAEHRRTWRRSLPWLASAAASLALAGLFGVPRLTGRPSDFAQNAFLRIETQPAGASVWVDGRRRAQSPVVLGRLERGAHHLRISQEGHSPAELTLLVTDGMGEVPLRFALAALTTPLDVRTQDGVTVRLDGRRMGTTPMTPLRVSPGPHQVRLERDGYVPQVHALLAQPGVPVVVDAQLAPAPAGVGAAEAPLVSMPAAGEALELGEGLSAPRRIAGEAALYPEDARRLQLAGSVLLELTIEPDGRPSAVRVLESAGSTLDQAVVEALRDWRFEPARKDGLPVRVRWRYRQTFQPQ